MPSSLALSLPNDVWTRIIDYGRIHFIHRDVYTTLMDAEEGSSGGRDDSRLHVLARCSLVCRRFAALCLYGRFEFVLLKSASSLAFFQDLVRRDFISLDTRHLGSMVKDLRYFPKDTQDEMEEDDGQVTEIGHLLSELPSLQHLGFSSISSRPSLSSSMALLQGSFPPLTSLACLDLSPESFHSFISVLHLLQPTLQFLNFLLQNDPLIRLNPTSSFPILTLSALHTLIVSDLTETPSQLLWDLLTSWNLPKLRRVEFAMEGADDPTVDSSAFFLKHGARIEEISWGCCECPDESPSLFLPHLRRLSSLKSLACPPFVLRDAFGKEVLAVLQGVEDFVMFVASRYLQEGVWEEGGVLDEFVEGVSTKTWRSLRRLHWKDRYDEDGGGGWKRIVRWLDGLKKEGVSVSWT